MIIEYPLLTEKSVGLIEKENKIVFVVNKNSTKSEIKKAVEKEFAIKVDSVNTVVSMKGIKKAYIKLKPEFKAVDLATRLKIV
jgi:large subunit ribosomal protein L23